MVNMAQSRREARQAMDGMVMIARQFLQVGVRDYGYLLRDPDVPRATRRQEAFTLYNPMSPASRGIRALANQLLNDPKGAPKAAGRGFLERFVSYFRAG